MNKRNNACWDSKLLALVRSCSNNATVKSMLTPRLTKANDGWGTLLHYAAASDNAAIVRHLIKLGAKVNGLTRDGQTALMVAVRAKSPRAVKALLAVNADIYITKFQEKNVFHVICDPRYDDAAIAEMILLKWHRETGSIDELVAQLVAAGCSFYTASLLQNIKVLERLLEHGCDVNSTNFYEKTALHEAVSKDNLKLAKWLIVRGANVDAKDRFGRFVLFYALECTNTKMIKLLLNMGANPNIENGSWNTPLFILCMRDPNKQVDQCIEILLQRDAVVKNDNDPNSYMILLYQNPNRINMLVAHLALLDKLGILVAKSAMSCLEKKFKSKFAKKYFERCQQMLEVVIFGTLSLFDFLTMSDHKMRGCVRNKTLVRTIERTCSRYRWEDEFSYFFNALSTNISSAVGAVKLEDKAIQIICDFFNGDLNEFYVVGRKIVRYLTLNDLELLSHI